MKVDFYESEFGGIKGDWKPSRLGIILARCPAWLQKLGLRFLIWRALRKGRARWI